MSKAWLREIPLRQVVPLFEIVTSYVITSPVLGALSAPVAIAASISARRTIQESQSAKCEKCVGCKRIYAADLLIDYCVFDSTKSENKQSNAPVAY